MISSSSKLRRILVLPLLALLAAGIGTGNLCTAVAVTVHDDTANQCIYPVAAAGACTVDNAKTLATFTAAAASEANAFQLGPLAAGASKIVSIGTQFDAAAGNQYQGR